MNPEQLAMRREAIKVAHIVMLLNGLSVKHLMDVREACTRRISKQAAKEFAQDEP